jgi:hypothetical protein
MVELMKSFGSFNSFQIKFDKYKATPQFVEDMMFFSVDAKEQGNYIVFDVLFTKQKEIELYLGYTLPKIECH